jgi:hypothetical protein
MDAFGSFLNEVSSKVCTRGVLHSLYIRYKLWSSVHNGQNLIVRTFYNPIVCALSKLSAQTMRAIATHSRYMHMEIR